MATSVRTRVGAGDKTTGLTCASPATVNAQVGDLILAFGNTNTAQGSTGYSCVDTGGNSYAVTFPGSGNATVFAAMCTTAMTNGTVTITFPVSSTTRSIMVYVISGTVTGTPVLSLNNSPTGATCYGVGNWTNGVGPVNKTNYTADNVGALILGVVYATATPQGATATPDTDTFEGTWDTGASFGTTGGSAATNCSIWAQHKVATGVSAQNWNAKYSTNNVLYDLITVNVAPPAPSTVNPLDPIVCGQAVQRASSW